MQTTPAVTATTPQPGHYDIDPSRSRVTFATVTHCEASRRAFTARATTRIDRTEFGITAARGLAARFLDLTVEVQCTRN
jgi:hypothetical protein